MGDADHWAMMTEQERCGAAQEASLHAARPSTKYRPRLSIDGNQWCALYGENLQTGVAGFGASPADAFTAFDAAWAARIVPTPESADEGGEVSEMDLELDRISDEENESDPGEQEAEPEVPRRNCISGPGLDPPAASDE